VDRADSWETVELFQRQARILSHLNHPGIPRFIDFFTEETEKNIDIYLIQGYIDGKSLAQLIEGGKHFTESEVIEFIHALADILGYLHSFSPPLIHRNIKPNNILIGKDGKVYLVDFGVIKDKLLHDSPVPTATIEESYSYIAIEEFRGQANTASDIYALGATMIYALSHVDPIQMGTMGSRLDFHGLVNISEQFARILTKMVEPDWERRYQSTGQLLIELEELLCQRPSERKWILGKKKIAWIGAAAVIAVMVILGVTMNTKSPPKPEKIKQEARRAKKTTYASYASRIATEKSVYRNNEPIVVNYSGLPGNRKDWITIVRSSAPDNTYNQWFYTKGNKSGNHTFNGVEAGAYEIRLYYDWPRGGYNVLRRHKFTVNAQAKVVEANVETLQPVFPLKVRLFYKGKPVQDFSEATPVFSVFHVDAKKTLTSEAVFNDEYFELQDIPKGPVHLHVDIDTNLANPKKYPGDLIQWGASAKLPEDKEGIDIDLAEIIHLISPQDNRVRMKNTGAVDCQWPSYFDKPIEFEWESLGDDVTYFYTVGTVDCVNHVYYQGNVAKGETRDTSITLELPVSKQNEKYAFHVQAKKHGRWIGRLYIHDEGGSDWNYGFRVNRKETGPAIRGRIMFDGRPVSMLTRIEPSFWFRNEAKGTAESAHAEYRDGRFLIRSLPEGRMGMSINLDLNQENPWSYPGDLRSWTTFQVRETDNPELVVHMRKIIRLIHPQDNGTVMDRWGAPCMEKIAFTSPVTFEWEPLAPDVYYDFSITRMDCLNHYISNGTVAGKTVKETKITIGLPESKENECYGFHITARKEGRRIGMLITHGGNGYGWDYRFRVIQ
jgi:serine/threonine protein kinase